MKYDKYNLLANIQSGPSNLKSLAALMALEGLERSDSIYSRHNHGLYYTGLDKFYQDYFSNFNFASENNHAVTQETAEFLLRTFRTVAAGNNATQLSEQELTIGYMTQYLQNPKATCSITSAAALLNPQIILNAFGYRAAYLVAQVSEELERHGYAWKNTAVTDINRMFKAHCQYMIIRRLFTTGSGASLWQRQQQKQHTSSATVTTTTTTTTTSTHSHQEYSKSNSSISPGSVVIVEQKLQQQEAFVYLYALNTLEAEISDFILSGYISAAQAKMVKEQVIELTARIQSDVVGPLMDVLVLSTRTDHHPRRHILLEDEEDEDPFIQYYRRHLVSPTSLYWRRYYNKGNEYERSILEMVERQELNSYYRALAALGRHRDHHLFEDECDERRYSSGYREIAELAERVALRDFYLALGLNRVDGKTYERMIGLLPTTSVFGRRRPIYEHDHLPFIVDNYENFVKLFVHNALQKRRWTSKL